MWHKFIKIAVPNCKMSYHTSIRCEPTKVFHGGIHYNVLDRNMCIFPQKPPMPNWQICSRCSWANKMIFQDERKNSMQDYINYKAYHDNRTKASNLKKRDVVFVLEPKADQQGNRNSFRNFRWTGHYNAKKALPNNIYLVHSDNSPTSKYSVLSVASWVFLRLATTTLYIVRFFQTGDPKPMPFREQAVPRLTRRVFTHVRGTFHSRRQHFKAIIDEKVSLGEKWIPHKTLNNGNRWLLPGN